MKQFLTLLLALVVWAVPAPAQLTQWQNISSKNFVMKIIHDKNFTYVGTRGGGIVKIDKQSGHQTLLNRADEDITDNSIADMALHNGELWVGTEYYGLTRITEDGIEKFDRNNAGFYTSQHISGIYFNDDGTMLVGGIAYLYEFDGEKCTIAYDINPLSPYAYVKSIKADADGRIWVACYDALNQMNLCIFTSNGLVPFSHSYGRVNNIETDANGCLWMATNNGLVKYDGRDFTQYTPDNSTLPEMDIINIMTDGQGNLWMTSDHYITKFDGDQFTNYPYQLNVADDYLLTIDADGDDVYVGSRFEGLLKLTEDGLTAVDLVDNVLYDNTMSDSSGCIDGNGNFCVGSLYGLQTYNIDTGDYKFEPMTQTAQIEADRDGNVWILMPWFSADTCLIEITPTGKTVYLKSDYPFSENAPNQIKFDRQNRLWLATNKGLFVRDGQTWTDYNKSNSGLSFEHVNSMAFDSDNHLWCGTHGGGLFSFDGAQWCHYTSSNSQLPSDYVGTIAIDKNDVVWLNCRDLQYPDHYGLEYGFGLTRFDGNSWENYNRANSPLPSDCFWDLQVDADNRKWIATAGDVGLVCLDENEWTIYDVDNSGIAMNEVTKITIDSKRDLIWLTHYPGSGISVAQMNSQASGIQSVEIEKTDKSSAIYDLQGRQVKNPGHGIYIQNGHLIIR